MFKAVELPAAVADLDPGLANVDGQALPHDVSKVQKTITKCKVQGARCKVQQWVRGWCKVRRGPETKRFTAPRLPPPAPTKPQDGDGRSLKSRARLEAGCFSKIWDFSTLRPGGAGVENRKAP